jgi:hypothetical protein
MKRLTLRLLISLTTFALGVMVTVLYLTRPAPSDFIPPVVMHESPSASAPPSCFPGLSLEVDKLNASSYFPPGVFYPQPQQEKFIVEWYTKHLSAMGETSLLSQSNSQAESYRFLWLRSFHHPVAVRIWRSGDGQFLNVKQMSGTGGYEPGNLISDETRPLTQTEWDEFIRLSGRACYWQLPTENNEMGKDGAQWILEGRRERRYHVVERWSPGGGDFREACLYLLMLSNPVIDLSREEVY